MLSIPIPPSVNAIWRAVRRVGGRIAVHKSAGYRRWLLNAVPLMRYGMPVATRPARILIVIRSGKGWPVSRDLDNIAKPVQDALRMAGRIEDDDVRGVVELRVRYEEVFPRGQAECLIGFFLEES